MDTNKFRIYTRGGDKGKTSLVGGTRVEKFNVRLESYGTIDELNSFIGLLLSYDLEQNDVDFLFWLQNKLFDIGGYLATESSVDADRNIIQYVNETTVSKIEKEIDAMDDGLPPLKSFILPAGGRTASISHICRTICRRAERHIYRLNSEFVLEPSVLKFINRLSDYFFYFARKEALRTGHGEVAWRSIKD